MKQIVTALLFAIALGVGGAMAQTEADTDAAVDNMLGDHLAYRAVFDAMQAAIAEEDVAAFAALVDYPITVEIDGEAMILADAAEFETHAEHILTPEITEAIENASWAEVMVNYQGIMIGDGQVWINGICADDKCTAFSARIVTLQSAAQ